MLKYIYDCYKKKKRINIFVSKIPVAKDNY